LIIRSITTLFIELDINFFLKSIYNKNFEYLEMLANIYKQEVVNIKTHNIIVVDVLGNKINKFSEHENNLLTNQNTRLSETKYPENNTNMPIYLPLPTLLPTIQKKRSLLLSDFPEQDTTLQANLPVSKSLPETS
jgi:hypothetical protein